MASKYLKEFEKLNTTTDSIYDLGDKKVLIVLKDGTNLTRWDDVENIKDVIYISEDLSLKCKNTSTSESWGMNCTIGCTIFFN